MINKQEKAEHVVKQTLGPVAVKRWPTVAQRLVAAPFLMFVGEELKIRDASANSRFP